MGKLKSLLAGLIGMIAADTTYAACDQTLSVGANISAAVATAANGSTICLNTGDYGTVNFYDINRSGFVSLQSASGTGAKMSAQVGNSKYIKFVNVTMQDVLVNNCSMHIHFIGTPFVPHSGGLLFNNNGFTCAAGNQDYLVDGATFSQVGQALYEGRLNFVRINGAVVQNSTFSGISSSSPSDGIQLLGGATNVVIGPNNKFTGILESLCGAVHCDAIQDYGGGPNNSITGNFFSSGDTFIMMPDGSSTYSVTNNIFDGSGSSYIDKIQFGSASSPIFRHNTIKATRVSFDSKVGMSASTNVQAQNNILINGSSWKTSNGSGCSNCNFSYNLFDSNASGTNNLIGTPTFVGGASPSTWSGWQLTSSSIGYLAGNDGKDMGTNHYGSAAVTPPPPPPPTLAAPSNLRLISVSSNQVQIQWDYSGSGQSGFQVHRKTTTSGSYAQLATTASLSLTDSSLAASTQYCYQVKAYNSTTTSSASNELCVTTSTPAPQPGDTQAPVTSITSPADGSTVARRANITITANASDDVGVTRVEFYINGALTCTDTVAAYSCNWSVPGKPGKNYQIQVKAYDASGKVGTSSIVNITAR